MEIHRVGSAVKDEWPEGLEQPLATFGAPLGRRRLVEIHDDRLLMRVNAAAVVEIPFDEIEAAGTGAFRVAYPGNPPELNPSSTRLVPALALYFREHVSLEELKAELPSQTLWDPAQRHIWTHQRHGLIVEWDGLTPGIASALDLLKVDKAKGEIELSAAFSSPAAAGPSQEQAEETGRAVGGLVAIAMLIATYWCGGTDERKDRERLEAEKRRGRPVLERQGATAIEWHGRVWERGYRSRLACVGFAATRMTERETGRYCERGSGESYVVWDKDRTR